MTPDDIAEIIVFAATRRENVVVADSLVFPSHQVCSSACDVILIPLVIEVLQSRRPRRTALGYDFADRDKGCFNLDSQIGVLTGSEVD